MISTNSDQPVSATAPSEPHRTGRRSLLTASILAALIGALMVAWAARPLIWPAPGPQVYAGIPANGYTLGDPSAPVSIDIYMDFQCSICRDWYTTVFPDLQADALKSGSARLVFHGLSALGPESVAAAKAAYAVERQGRFWDMWTVLYAHQGPENSGVFTDPALRLMAEGLGIDMARYDADFASSDAQTFVDKAEADSRAQGITGTPTLVIAGVQYQGVSAYPALRAVIEAAARAK